MTTTTYRDERRPVLRVQGLSVRFGGVQAVRGLSFDVSEGWITALIGPNGAGKTTVFNLVTGVVPPDEGRILVDNQDVTGLASHDVVRKGIGRTFQDVRVFPQMTVLDNIVVGFQRVSGMDFASAICRWRRTTLSEQRDRHRAERLMKAWDLWRISHQLAADLSYGEQKLVALARAVIAEPRVLLLDEPLAGLGSKAINDMLSVIRQLVATGCTLLVVEHNVTAVMQISDHVVVMHLGEKIAEGPPAHISSHPKVREVYLGA